MLKSQEGVQITTTMTQDTQTDFRNDYFRHFPQGIPVPLHGVRIKVSRPIFSFRSLSFRLKWEEVISHFHSIPGDP